MAPDWGTLQSHPHIESTFTGTLVNVGDLHQNSGGGSGESVVSGLPNFANLLRSSPDGARTLPIGLGNSLT